MQPRVERGALGRRMRPDPVGPQTRQPRHDADVAPRPAHVRRNTPVAALARGETRPGLPGRRAVAAEDLNHAAGRVAVQRRERAPQHFHTLGAGKVGVRELGLPVGLRGGDAVHVHAQAADAEAGARAETPDRQLGVLGVILAVAHQQARDALQRFGGIHARSHRGHGAHRYRGRRVEHAGLAPGGRDVHRLKRGGLAPRGRIIRPLRLCGYSWRTQRQRRSGGQSDDHSASRKTAVPRVPSGLIQARYMPLVLNGIAMLPSRSSAMAPPSPPSFTTSPFTTASAATARASPR